MSAAERHLGYGLCGSGELKELSGWLEERALEHDRPVTLFAMACDHLMSEGVVRPGVTTVERSVVAARGRAWIETFRRLEPQLSVQRCRDLDRLLGVDDELGMSTFAWLRRLPTGRFGVQVRELVAVRQRLIDVGAAEFDVSMLNPNRVRHLAALSRRMDAQSLARMNPERRYPILVATLVEGLVSTSDLILDLFDTAVGAIDRKARRDLEEHNKAQVVAASDTVSVFTQIARVLLDPDVPDERVRSEVWNRVGRQRLVETAALADQITVSGPGGHLPLVASQYRKARKFAPAVLEAFEFQASAESRPLLAAVEMLAQLYANGARKLPPDVPVAFVPDRWMKHIRNPDDHIDRYGWEMCVLSELRDGLRGANIWVDHGRRYQDPAKHLIDDLEMEPTPPRPHG